MEDAQKTPIKRFLTKIGESPRMVYAWNPTQAAKPNMVECDVDGTPFRIAPDDITKSIPINQMNKPELSKIAKTMRLKLDHSLKLSDLRQFVAEQKALREMAVNKMLESMHGISLTKEMLASKGLATVKDQVDKE